MQHVQHFLMKMYQWKLKRTRDACQKNVNLISECRKRKVSTEFIAKGIVERETDGIISGH